MARKTPTKINPNKLKGRDPLMVRLINGATKSGFHKQDRREEKEFVCRECFGEYRGADAGDGFCSDQCSRDYDRGLTGAEEG